MLGLKIVKNEQVEEWMFIEDDYYSRLEENARLKMQLRDEQELINILKNKLHGTKAVIYDIKKDKEGNDSYICVRDSRSPSLDDDFHNINLTGSVDLFVLSAVIRPSNVSGRYIDMPHLQATFGKTNVVIDELHSDIDDGIYENKGYATMLLEVLIDIAKKSNCKSITGYLSNVDAKTAEKKEKRNGFYSSKGFELSFVDDLHEEGHICLYI